jgi:hypothetical protein
VKRIVSASTLSTSSAAPATPYRGLREELRCPQVLKQTDTFVRRRSAGGSGPLESLYRRRLVALANHVYQPPR